MRSIYPLAGDVDDLDCGVKGVGVSIAKPFEVDGRSSLRRLREAGENEMLGRQPLMRSNIDFEDNEEEIEPLLSAIPFTEEEAEVSDACDEEPCACCARLFITITLSSTRMAAKRRLC